MHANEPLNEWISRIVYCSHASLRFYQTSRYIHGYAFSKLSLPLYKKNLRNLTSHDTHFEILQHQDCSMPLEKDCT